MIVGAAAQDDPMQKAIKAIFTLVSYEQHY